MHGLTRGLLATDCEIAAARWVQRKLGDCTHERRVLAISAKLFELTRPVLNLGLAENRLLRLAALVHDVGRCVSDKDHPQQGAEMLAQTSALELSPHDRRALAFLTRYHRGANVPETDREEYLGPHDRRPTLHAILALLRAADALDSRRLPPPQLVVGLQGRRLGIHCLVHPEHYRDAREVFDRKKKFNLLSDLLGTPVAVQIDRSVALAS